MLKSADSADRCRTGMPRRSRPVPARNAAVLLLVLIVVVMIALAGFGFVELMLTENKAAHLHGDELRLEQAIGSGVELLKSLCDEPATKQSEAGGLFNNPTALRGIPLTREDRRARGPKHEVRFSIIAPLGDGTDAGGIRFGVENESGRLHLADLLRWEKQQPGSGRKALMNFPGMTEGTADAILDWIDFDAQPREMGAENDYYSALAHPYAPRNALPECLEELLLVKGVTRELLFGADANHNAQVDPEERIATTTSARGSFQAIEFVPWASLLTLYSGRRNLTSAGRPRIHLNGMDLATLQQQLSQELDANWAAFIVAYRQYGPYGGTDPGSQNPPPINTAMTPRFVISTLLDLAGAKVAIPGATAQQTPKVYVSPLASDPQTIGQQLPRLFDKTSVFEVPVIRGGVSVNHAPRNVLRCVPGIDSSLADRIVAARTAEGSTDDANRRIPTWLLSEGLVDLPTMKNLLPHVSAGGEVVRAQVVAHFDDGGPTARAEIVVDATTLPSRQVVWRDLRFWGAGYPLEWLDAESAREGAPRSRAFLSRASY